MTLIGKIIAISIKTIARKIPKIANIIAKISKAILGSIRRCIDGSGLLGYFMLFL